MSVCIAAYNAEHFLAEALGSVQAQTYRNIEIILIDDASVDRTYEVAQSVADERVRCFRVFENLGAYQAMNKAVSMAAGEFIAIYHCDDHYESTIVAREVAYLQSHPDLGAVFSLSHLMDEKGRVFGGASLPSEFVGKDSLGYDEVFRFILRNKNVLFCCPTFMVRSQVLKAVGLFAPENFATATDLEMWIRIIRQFPVGILNERLMRYRVRGDQWTARYHHLRTTPADGFYVLDHYMAKDRWLEKLSRGDLTEYAFHRCDDDSFCAANLVILGDVAGAKKLLQCPYPWRTLLSGNLRRKLRLLVLRAMILGGLSIGATRLLARILRRIGR